MRQENRETEGRISDRTGIDRDFPATADWDDGPSLVGIILPGLVAGGIGASIALILGWNWLGVLIAYSAGGSVGLLGAGLFIAVRERRKHHPTFAAHGRADDRPDYVAPRHGT